MASSLPAARIRTRLRQRGQRGRHDASPAPFEQEDIRVVPLRIAATDAHDAALRRHRHAVPERTRQAESAAPRAVGFFEDEHRVIPLLAQRLRPLVTRDIRAAAHDQRAAAHSGERPREAFRIRNRGKFFPHHRLGGIRARQRRNTREHAPGAQGEPRKFTEQVRRVRRRHQGHGAYPTVIRSVVKTGCRHENSGARRQFCRGMKARRGGGGMWDGLPACPGCNDARQNPNAPFGTERKRTGRMPVPH